MKKVWLLMFVAVVLSMQAQAQPGAEKPIRKVSAKEVRAMIDSSKGPAIFNFWATWCTPCIHEIPWFDSIMAAKNSSVKLVLVSVDFKSAYPKDLAAFVKAHGYKGEVLYLDETNIDAYIHTIEPKWKGGIPASVFVNNATKYYQVYNEQIPKQRFEMELNKLGH